MGNTADSFKNIIEENVLASVTNENNSDNEAGVNASEKQWEKLAYEMKDLAKTREVFYKNKTNEEAENLVPVAYNICISKIREAAMLGQYSTEIDLRTFEELNMDTTYSKNPLTKLNPLVCRKLKADGFAAKAVGTEGNIITVLWS